ncbi:MAG: HigA family addiction module antidote protein [Bacteroidetes bacterium]|jgi:addiction module HigA family antidote|nr:HigA family addiction module antidote protein [Bacteroidota bacterium]
MSKKREFANDMIPGNTYHPGEYIKDELEARNMSQQELARKMKVSKSEISLVINGHRNINPKIAVLLELALGIDAEIWMNLQVNHDIDLIKIKMRDSIKKAKISKSKKEKFKKLVAAA